MATLSILPSQTFDDDDDDDVWVSHYSSNHHILLVGEGDFSFSSSLATIFSSASHICASSLDSYNDVVTKYKNARSNLDTLNRLGAFLLHGVDATKLHSHPLLHHRRFDRIIFNFPHSGFHNKESDSSLIRKHRALVLGFFHGASRMLRPDGQIHVSHKNKSPFCLWNLEELASRCFLVLIQRVPFDKSYYPGYENKRGAGSRCDQPFILGDCSTFKFRFCRVAKEIYAEKFKCRQLKERESQCPQSFPDSFNHGYPLLTDFQGVSQIPLSFDLSYHQDPNLREVQEPLLQSRHRPSPLDFCYYQEYGRSQFEDARFQDNLRQLDKLAYTERSSLLCQDYPFKTNHHHQEHFQEFSNHLNGFTIDTYNGEMRRSFPHPYAGESSERQQLLCQNFPVRANQEPYLERFNGVSHGRYNEEVQRTFGQTSFPHPYTRESQDQSLIRQRNLNIQPPQHW